MGEVALPQHVVRLRPVLPGYLKVNVKLRPGEGKDEGEREDVGHLGDDEHEVVPVALDEVVAGDGGGVDVVLAEGADEGLSEGPIHAAPGVREPVDEAGGEVRRDDAEEGVGGDGLPGGGEREAHQQRPQVEGHEGQAQTQAHRLLHPLPCTPTSLLLPVPAPRPSALPLEYMLASCWAPACLGPHRGAETLTVASAAGPGSDAAAASPAPAPPAPSDTHCLPFSSSHSLSP